MCHSKCDQRELRKSPIHTLTTTCCLTFCTNCGFTVISWSMDFSFSSSSIHFNICKGREDIACEVTSDLFPEIIHSGFYEQLLNLHLLIDFVEHCRIVVFFRVVVEADHTILLVNASVDLTVLNLCTIAPRQNRKEKDLCHNGVPTLYIYTITYYVLRALSSVCGPLQDLLTMCKTYFSASCGPDSCTRLAMSCKDNVRKVCQVRKEQEKEKKIFK